MLVTMKHSRLGSQDGFAVERYHANTTYDLPDSLGAYFVRQKAATPTEIIDGCTNPAWYNLFSPEFQRIQFADVTKLLKGE